MKQAAMYVRVSTTQQKEQHTIESQKSMLLKFAQERGYEIPPQQIFEDNGFSGSNLARPALDRFRDLAAERVFDFLFVLSPDRLARKYAYQVLLLEELKNNGVQVLFKCAPHSNTPEEVLLEQMQGMFAEYERAQIMERTRRGKIHKAKKGCVNVLTGAPYGYRYICATPLQEAYFEVIEHEAQIVRDIYDLYVKERLSIAGIIKYLFNKKIVTAKGLLRWSRSSVLNILSNSTYRGVAYFGVKGKAEPDPTRLESRRVRIHGRKSPKRGTRERPSDEWIPIPVPSIIDEELYKLAEELRNRNKNLSARNTKRGTLLQGLISCNECGYGFVASRSGSVLDNICYYRCSNKKNGCKNRGIRVEQLDKAIWDTLSELLECPMLIQEEVSRRLSEIKQEPIAQKNNLLKKKLVKLEEDSSRLLDAFQEGCVELPELKSRMSKIKHEIGNIKRAIIENGSGMNQEQLLELHLAVEYFSKHLKAAKKDLPLEERRKVMRMLIKEIKIGSSDIEITHTLPWCQNKHANQNARLSSSCQDGVSQPA